MPKQEQIEFLIERKVRVDIMRALIESGADPEKAKEALTDPVLIEIVEVDERGNKIKKNYH